MKYKAYYVQIVRTHQIGHVRYWMGIIDRPVKICAFFPRVLFTALRQSIVNRDGLETH